MYDMINDTGFEVGGKRICFSIYCPTYSYYLTGWRKTLSKIPFVKSKWFKHERIRIAYGVDNMLIVSPETYVLIEKNGLDKFNAQT